MKTLSFSKDELEIVWRALGRYSYELSEKVENKIGSFSSSYEEYEERMNICDNLFEKTLNEWREMK